VTGEGVSQVVEIHEGATTAGAVVASGTAATLGGGRDLGSIDVSAGATGSVTITLVNAGALTLKTETPTLTGTHAADFTLTVTSATLAPQAVTRFTVTFDPTQGGIKDAQIEFKHDDPTNPNPFIVPIMGTAVDPAAVRITTTSLPSGSSGSLYPTTPLTAIQGVGALTWSLYSGNLPTGLTLSAAGVISGTPTSSSTASHNFIIRVDDTSGATHEKALSIAVAGSVTISSGGVVGGCVATNSSSNLWLALLGLFSVVALSRRMRTTKQ
jgi:hypothetical protein